ncbi:MAG: TIGR03560 family F420-dependent LLM class oxidoreductase [Dehalococcoidia bacterium]
MKFAAWLNLAVSWEAVLDQARHVEATGWDGIYLADHFMPNAADNSGPTQECWTSMAAIAASTSRVRIGSLVSGNTYRHPALLAKMAAQVDIISNGRLVLGLGAGWQENEHQAYGIDYHTLGGRMRRLEESAEIIKSLFQNTRTDFHGRAYTITDAPLAPKPVQAGGPPLLIGGGGEQRTLRIAARFADEWNVWGSPETLARKGEVLARHCEEIGRDPATIRHSCQAMVTLSDDPQVVEAARQPGRPVLAGNAAEIVDALGRYAEAGVDEFIVPNFNFGRASKDVYDRLMSDVIPQLR